MTACRQPGQQTGLGRGQVDTGHANLGESKLLGRGTQVGEQVLFVEWSAVDHHLPIVGTEQNTPGAQVAPGQSGPALQLRWPDESATQAFARALVAQPGLERAFITLHGDLGAGKTTLARHLLQALGVEGRIKSPTYAIAETYDTERGPIWHCDFYRFNDPQEWEEAGFRDIFAGPGLKLVEWPQKAEGLLPAADLDIAIATVDASCRQVSLQGHSALGHALVQGLAKAVTKVQVQAQAQAAKEPQA